MVTGAFNVHEQIKVVRNTGVERYPSTGESNRSDS
jgi:hypothetical protein